MPSDMRYSPKVGSGNHHTTRPHVYVCGGRTPGPQDPPGRGRGLDGLLLDYSSPHNDNQPSEFIKKYLALTLTHGVRRSMSLPAKTSMSYIHTVCVNQHYF